MNRDIRVNNLIESLHWRQFMESTATALQINLIFLISETGSSISVCDSCPACDTVLTHLSLSDMTGLLLWKHHLKIRLARHSFQIRIYFQRYFNYKTTF